ncbi:MAG: hybrid sensor histidine kinase/response regulator, partial [Prevotellaceae bacterium]|nr:hybrid sensor histidine kinase/response regulator [Prevotellaceae bacterium]
MKHTRILYLLLLSASTLPLPHPVKAQEYYVTRLGVEDGLSSNYVVDVVQDHKGYIWVATEAGLNRFDGREFDIYTKHNSGLKGNEINVLLPDPVDDKVWIGTIYDGLHAYDYRTDSITTDLDTKNAPLDDDVADLAPASDDGIWVVHAHAGIDHYDRKTRRFTPYTPENVKGMTGDLRTAREDMEGHLYIGHHLQGFSVLDLKDRTARHFRHDAADGESLPGDDVNCILIDRNNNVWVGTNKGLALFHPQTGKFTCFHHRPGDEGSLISDQVTDILQMADGKLWVGTYMGGVSILDLTENAFTTPDKAVFRHLTATLDGHGLSGPNARSLLQDTYGNIWIGNYRGGLDFISYARPQFETISYPTGEASQAASRQVWGVWADKEGIVLGGEGEIALYDTHKGWRKVPLPPDRSHTHINAIFRDSRGRYWLGTWLEGLLVYDGAEVKHIGGKDADELDVRAFSEDADGRIWICTSRGLYTYYRGLLQRGEQLNSQLPDLAVCGAFHAPDGKLWVTTSGRGVAVFDRQGRLARHLNTAQGFPTGATNTLKADNRGRILVGTHDGLVIFPDPSRADTFQVFGAEAGLKNTSVRAIHEDRDGRLWMSTNGGISCLDEATGKFFNFDYRDGVPQGDFMDNSACL